MITRLNLHVFLILGIANIAYADDCSNVIALSKVSSTAVEDQSSFESHAANFCKEYSKSKSSAKSASYGASYKVLSASMGSSGASASTVASKYCSATDITKSRNDAYQKYVETISPLAYSAYETCKKMASEHLKMKIDPASVLPEEFSVELSFASNVRGDTAEVYYVPSDGLDCNWLGSVEEMVSLNSGTSEILSCKRDDRKKRSYVKLVRTNAATKSITIPWQSYNEDGMPVDVFLSLEKKYSDLLVQQNQLLDSLGNAIVAFESNKCPTGWEAYTPAYGRFLRGLDPTNLIDVDRSNLSEDKRIGSLQQDSLAGHSHKYALSSDRKGYPASSGDISNGNAVNQSYWRGNKKAELSSNTSNFGGKETRPKNVALLFCKQKRQEFR